MKIKRLIPLMILGTLMATPTFAITSESSSDLQFTFQPILSLSFSEANLSISGLHPGTFGQSNSIDVVVNTNNISGYILSAAVGDGTTFLNTDLVNTRSATPFVSLATTDSVESFEVENTWGYTLDYGATFSGLPYYGADNWKILKQTKTNSSDKSIQFGIVAKADRSLAAGDYRNVIQFRVIANPVPEEPDEIPGD